MPASSSTEPTPKARSSTEHGAGARAIRVLTALASLQTTRPYAVLLVAALTVALAAIFASRLSLRTSLGELLPANKDSVIVAEQVRQRLVSSSTLFVVAQSRDTEALKRFVDALAPELRKLPRDTVGAVDDGVRDATKFFTENRFLYAPLEDVQKVHDKILERYEYEVQKAAGMDLGFDDDEGEAPEPLTAESIKKTIEERQKEAQAAQAKYPDGYYMEPDGHLITVVMRTPVSTGDIDKASALLKTVRGVIDRVGPTRFAPDMAVNFAGSLITGMEEYSQIKGDLTEVGALGVAMILGVVFIFYIRLRTLLAMALSVGIGVIWTFGLAYLLIGYLNASTGFLASIIVGNGINFSIIYMTRYFEEFRVGDVRHAVLTAHITTWLATLAAAGAAMVAYGSLVVTDFRGFKHFGVIGGSGMILCWVATYLFLPAILVVMERASARLASALRRGSPDSGAVFPKLTAFSERLRGVYGRPFAFVVERFPRAIAVGGVVLGLVGAGLTVHYVRSDPMEYDMRKTRTEPKTGQTLARQLGTRVDRIVGRGQDGLAIMVDRLDQVKPLRAALEARRDAAPAGRKPFDRVADIYDLLPKDQEKKIPLLEEAKDRLERAHRRGIISEADWAKIEEQMPKGGLRALGVEDLPEQVARMFTEKDGTRGRLVYIVPASGRSVWDGHYLLEWADSFRSTTLPDGSVIKGSGNAVIFADVLISVVEDAPKAIVVSLVGTLLIILLTFRGRAAALAVIASLALGLVWMMAALALYDVKITLPPEGPVGLSLVGLRLNFLNFIALPITIGVGADYAINVMQRYKLSGGERIHDVIVETGGAVILCSLTTTLGYFALTFSINLATVSFGYSAAAGEISCLIAAVLVLPAFFVWRDRRRAAAG